MSQRNISFESVFKHFSGMERPVLDNLSLEVEESKIHVLLGFSGTGKSVLIKHAVGLLQPDRGEVKVKGEVVHLMSEKQKRDLRKEFGILFQGEALFDSLNVMENIAFPLREHRKAWSEKQIRERVEELLEQVEMKDALFKMPNELSGGMKKRVGLARAMVLKPKFLFCDEPTSGLDPLTAQNIDELIVNTSRKASCTVLLITHDVHAALRMSDCVSFIWQGNIIETGNPAQFRRSKNEIVREFLMSAGVSL